jgi:hypothetical protein
VYLVERGARDCGVGAHVQCNFVVDRVASGMENQDPALLKIMLPVSHSNGVFLKDNYHSLWYQFNH